MVTGVHAVVFTKDVEAARAFFGETLGFSSVDAGGGWLIFRLPPAEVSPHPADQPGGHALYLMCDDIEATLSELKRKGVKPLTPVADQGWGLLTSIEIPGGIELGLYEPKHPTPRERAVES